MAANHCYEAQKRGQLKMSTLSAEPRIKIEKDTPTQNANQTKNPV